jgi:NDP-sugar pyrophosphorylase family protein
MKAGIIAAGLGERFRRAGITTPKPLVAVAGKTLLERAIEAAADAGAAEVALIVNAESPEVARYVGEHAWPVPVVLTVKTTPSSMESFFMLEPQLRDEPFLLTTVDAVTAKGTLRSLARAGLASPALGTLGVTTFVDDEKPLWVRLGADAEIVALGPTASGSGSVTSGSYFFRPAVYRHVSEARRRKLGALREFLALLLEAGERLRGFPAADSIDVDRPEDILTAERFLERDG